MEIIKRKILQEDYIDRNYNSPTYGTLTATTFYINVMLTQNIDDMGMFTDIIYLPNFIGQNTPVDYSILVEKLSSSGFTFPFMIGITPQSVPVLDDDIRGTGLTQSDRYSTSNMTITAQTESKLEDVKSYSNVNQYELNFNTDNELYVNFSGETINGVNRVTQLGLETKYVFDVGSNDVNIGTTNQKNGLLYVDNSATTNTTVSYIGQGWNETTLSLSAITKEEYLFGIISKPEVKSDIFIDRGITTIFEKQLKLSEIKNLDELARYGKGYYNLTKN
jgi:hypothetical protein